MDNNKKIKVINSTYVCNTNSNSSYYNKETLIVGAINNKNKHFKLYKSLLKVSKSDLKFDSDEKIYLFLFIDNIYVANDTSFNFSIFGNDEDFITSNTTWSTFPKKINRPHINVSVSLDSINKYIKIDITQLIKSLTSYTRSYNLILEVIAPSNLPYLIQLDSCNGKNTPFLTVLSESADNSFDYTEESNINQINDNMYENDNSNSNIKKGELNSYMDQYYTNIINRMNNQNQKLDSLEKNLNNILNSLETKIDSIRKDEIDSNNKIISEFKQMNGIFSDINKTMTSIKDYFETLKNETNSISENFPMNSLNNIVSDLNELTNNEILQLKNSVNDDIINLKNSINSGISNLNIDIKSLDNSILELSNQMSQLSSVMQNEENIPKNNEKN